jgi:hypothetical protein
MFCHREIDRRGYGSILHEVHLYLINKESLNTVRDSTLYPLYKNNLDSRLDYVETATLVYDMLYTEVINDSWKAVHLTLSLPN